MASKVDKFNVVVLSCGDLGIEVANELQAVQGEIQVTLVTTPYVRKPLGFTGKIKQIYRTQGWWGFMSVLFTKIQKVVGLGSVREGSNARSQELHSAISLYDFKDFHQSECLEQLRSIRADLGVVAGTYILKKDVFEIPRLGCINLHSGKAPEYRGAAPAFWELYNGEQTVGITIHRVASELDAGGILQQEVFPLNPMPTIDPLSYLDEYRREVLRPNGVRMIRQVVTSIMQNVVEERRQDPAKAKTYRTPDYAAVCELRKRVRERLREQTS